MINSNRISNLHWLGLLSAAHTEFNAVLHRIISTTLMILSISPERLRLAHRSYKT